MCSLELKQLSGVKKISPVGWKVLPKKQNANEPYIASEQLWEPKSAEKDRQTCPCHFHFPANAREAPPRSKWCWEMACEERASHTLVPEATGLEGRWLPGQSQLWAEPAVWGSAAARTGSWAPGPGLHSVPRGPGPESGRCHGCGRHSSCQHLSQMEPGSLCSVLLGSARGRRELGGV